MDFEFYLIVLVIFTCLAILFRSIRIFPIQKDYVWIIVTSLILTLTTYSLFSINKKELVIVCISLWIPLVLLPTVAMNFLYFTLRKKQYNKAYKWALVIRFFHPADHSLKQPQIIKFYLLIQNGDIKNAEHALQNFNDLKKIQHRAIIGHFFIATGQCQKYIKWVEQHFSPQGLENFPDVISKYLLALGENGRLKKMLETFNKYKKVMNTLLFKYHYLLSRLYLFAFFGEKELTRELCIQKLNFFNREEKRFWLATADLFAGKTKPAHTEFKELKNSSLSTVRLYTKKRLSMKPKKLTARLKKDITTTLAEEKTLLHQEAKYGNPLSFKKTKKRPYITLLMMGLIVFMFLLEILNGSPTNQNNLYLLGAMVKIPQYPMVWWRLFTAIFLHFGFMHFAVNLLSLRLIGPNVEKMLGSFKFLVIYLLSGIGSVFFAVQLSSHSSLILVGASGSIMGLLGSMAYLLFMGYKKEKSTIAFRSFIFITLIFILQIISDSLIPMSSLSSHFFGFLIGVFFTPLLSIIRTNKNK